jgi:hypothetical protein
MSLLVPQEQQQQQQHLTRGGQDATTTQNLTRGGQECQIKNILKIMHLQITFLR